MLRTCLYFCLFAVQEKKRTSVVFLNEQRAITKWLMRLFLSFLSPCVGPTATVPKLMSELVCFEVASEIWIRYVPKQFHNNSCLTNLLFRAKLIFLEIRFEAIEIACWILEDVCVQDIVHLLSIISEWLQKHSQNFCWNCPWYCRLESHCVIWVWLQEVLLLSKNWCPKARGYSISRTSKSFPRIAAAQEC